MAANLSTRYINYPILVDAQDLMQLAFAYLAAKIPGWQPSEGNLDTWMIEAIASEAADIGTLTSEVPKTIFRFLGATLFQIPPIEATAATCTATFTLNDSLGHTIEAGTQVGIRNLFGDLLPFTVLTDVIVAGGGTTGNVTLIAATPGSASSGLGSIGGNIEQQDIISWVDHIIQFSVTTGGLDAEDDDVYLSRLAFQLQTISPRPILPRDFAVLARNVPGVQRAVAIDGYNTANSTYNNARMVTVASLDSDGAPVGSSVKTAISAYLEALREINFVVNTLNVVIVEVDVSVVYTIVPGYNSGDVSSRVQAAVGNYINPAVWGMDSTDDPANPQTLNNVTKIRYLELATIINNVIGVDTITTLTIGLHGGTQHATDLDMSGQGVVVVPTISSGDITSTPS